MCGIFLYTKKHTESVSLYKSYHSMANLLSHRGNDASGIAAIPIYKDKKINTFSWNGSYTSGKDAIPPDFFLNSFGFIGHHRLSIISPDSSSNQPFTSNCGRIALSFNGEIYNYLELKNDLKSLGYQFRTSSDTEVVLAAYEYWGCKCFEKFNGDFALMFVDMRYGRIIGARDRFGVKPLFYWKSGSEIAISSEVKGFLGVSDFIPKLDELMSYQYLVAEFPTEQTLNCSFLEGVKPVPPGAYFEINIATQDMYFSNFWNIFNACDSFLNISYNEAAEELSLLLRDAVRLRLRSDVSLAGFLSGGLDSPSIVQKSCELDTFLSTYSSGFPSSDVDESNQIQKIASFLNIENHLNNVSFNQFIEEIDNLVYIQDEPFSTLNVYSQYVNFAYASKHGHKVMLDGGGADEYLAGYLDYIPPAAADGIEFINLNPDLTNKTDIYSRMNPAQLQENIHNKEYDQRRVDYINPELRAFVRGDSSLLDRPVPLNFKAKFNGSYLKYALAHSMQDAWMNKSVVWDNRYLDRSGMALGVEARVPFQDHRLIEFILSLPPSYICGHGKTKGILRSAMQNKLPYFTLNNTDKIGFEFPFVRLLRENSKFTNYFRELISSQRFKEFSLWSSREITNELNNIVKGTCSNYNIWRVFNLFLWHQRFIQP